MIRHFFVTALIGFAVTFSFGQNDKKVSYPIQEVSKQLIESLGTPQIVAQNAKYYQIDVTSLIPQMSGVMHREQPNSGFIANVSLPHPDGTFHSYRTMANSTLHPELNEKFPSIYTYDASGVDNGARVKWDITEHGLHAMIMTPGESTIYIDPVIKGNDDYYIVYRKADFQTDKIMDCSFNSDSGPLKSNNQMGTVKSFGTCELRTYRLALSATGEYTTFHGGTVAAAQAAQATTMNRVNGVYERDMAITMVIIANNDQIIYTNAGTDPFTNGTPGTMINENQSVCDGVIGSANYDIGHVFGTNSGGLAGLGVVCANSQKARGVTGSSAPIGDSFDIDYVAHEMGHQFGANHTQNNNCNRNNATAMEPGSASTIMGYAGICAPNVQSNSDDHFHGVSLEEIGFEILSGGHTCEQITALANSAPIVIATNGNVTVPANTPFALTATVTDADGDPVSYNWEQMDPEVSTQSPVPTSTVGPNFRSWPSSTSPTRYFPNLTDLAAGGPFTWEVIPSVSRTMNFRVTVRDNSPGAGGCNDHQDITVTTDAGSGPFIVLYPSATGIVWTGATTETVTWDVANTDVAPVACANVDILLSTDGGQTYPITLASNVPNDGSETITVPNLATTTARIMVICSDGTFFDISDNDFEIVESTFDYTLTTSPATLVVCQPNDANFTVDIGSIGGYNDPVTLSVSGVPAGATSSFSVNPVTPIGSSVLNVTNTGAAAPGDYTLTITANSTSGTKTNDVILSISSGTPATVTPTSPADLATGVSVPTSFTWTTAAGSGISYDIDIASDAGFTAIVDQATGLATASYNSSVLSPNTTYYWRVRTVSGCGSSAWSTVFSFTTDGCFTLSSTDTPVSISSAGTPTITSTINVPTTGTINDVNILDVNGNHTWINDLIVTVTSPSGTSVTLWSQICNNEDNFDVSFDDAAASAVLPCPPTGGGTYQPNGTLASFNGENPNGDWILTIQDMADQDGGSLNGWSLQICVDAGPCNQPDLPTLSGTTTICEGNSTTLSVTGGNLNDATDWSWYEGSCGGTLVGSGASIVVSPTSSTSYFVRGEGGCVAGGTCEQIDVVVNPIYNSTEDINICQGDSYTYPDGTAGTVTETHTSVLTSMAGCDSIIITNLTVNAPASSITLSSPADGATGVSIAPTSFNWTTAPETGVTYTIEIATDPGFTTIVETASGLGTNTYDATTLNPGTIYYWHVSAENTCGGAGFTSTFSFTTNSCVTYASSDVPVNIPNGTGTYTTTINIPVGGTINDVNVFDLVGNHGASGNLIFTLQSPAGTTVELMNQACGNDNDFDVDFDDEAASATLPCPVTDGNAYQPSGLLSDFDGEDQQGTWTLIIQDVANPNSGTLTGWSLEVCTDPVAPCTEPDVPSVSPATAICAGQTVTLSVTGGNLNDATDWTWYESSCGGTFIGTGATIVVTPGVSTSYFVRGEGGCVTPGTCAQVDVQVNPIYNETDAATICQGDSYTFGTQTLTAAGTYTEVFTSIDGCDSTVVLTLNVNPIYNETASATICQGDSYSFGTQTLTAAGTYTEVFTSMGGCDSTVLLTLDVSPNYNETDAATICQGNSYSFGTQTLTAAGTYTEVFTSVDGCDSIVVLTLNVNPSYNETASATICQGNSYTFGTQTLTAAGTYTEVFTSIDGCDSTVVLTLNVNPIYNETASATICQGDSYSFGTQTLTAAGTYTEVFTSMGGCDSTVVLTLDVSPNYNETASATICQGDSYTFGTQTLSAAGTYTEVFTSAYGCDSTVVLTLNVNPTYNETDAATICQGDSYSFGAQTLTAAGTYTEVFTSVDGCDSIVVLTLNVNPSYNETVSATICQGDSYTFGTQTLTAAGTYTELFTSIDGCDSTVMLTLNVNSSYNETDAATICQGDSYTFGTQTLTAAGTYTELFTSIDGCDSTVVLTLDVVTAFNTNDAASICAGQTYVFGTQTLNTAGTYTEMFTSQNGCDSLVTLDLTVNPIYNETASATICQGDSYSFGAQTLTTAGTYTEVFTSVDGCDSTVVLTLNVNPTYNQTVAATICQGDSYSFGTQTLTTAGSYTEVFTSMDGCDSIVVLTLDVNPTYNTTDAVTICNGQTYTFGTQTLNSSGTYTEVFTSVDGCDSTVVLTLDVIAAFNTSDAVTICQGETYVFGSQSLTTAGMYTETFTSAGGCDSTVALTLTVNPTYNETDAVTICQGDSYIFGAQTLSASGTYTEVFTSVDGCDSTVVLTLNVNPTYNETASATICQGDTYSFGTQSLTTAGSYTEIFSSVEGCDSIVVLTLNVTPAYNETASATICQGDTYVFGSQLLTSSGTYTEVFTSQNGCDSTVVLTLNVTSAITTNLFAQICQGETYTFGALNLTSGGTYSQTFTSTGGCDSTVNLTLNVLPTTTITESAVICEGQSYTFPDGTIGTATEAHISVLTGVNGCDSTVITALTVNPTYNLTEDVTICSGESYTFPDGTTGSTDMVYTSALTTVNGCDSIIVTTLNVQTIDNSVSVVNDKTITANQTGATYQWIDCDTGDQIAGEINQSFTPTSTVGNYAVIVTIGNCSDTSDCTLIDLSDLDEFEQSITIYPNPVSNELNITWTGDVTRIEITDAKGKLIDQMIPNAASMKLLMTEYANGVYFIHIFTDSGRYVYDVLKQ